MAKQISKGILSGLAEPGREFSVAVVPGAGRASVDWDGATLRVRVTAAPQDGKANAAVLDAMSRALGVAKGRLEILRGHKGRHKVVRLG